MRPKIFVVLGADRVGKSTLIENSRMYLSGNNHVEVLHFAGPQPHHNSPIDQYIEPLNAINLSKTDFVLCDRGFSEVCFYEKFRRNIIISEQWAVAAESYFKSVSSSVEVLMIEREWEWSRPKHIEEIDELYPDASNYFKRNQLLVREEEHRQYYNYMSEYLKNVTTLPYQVIQPTIFESVSDYLLV